MDIILKYFSDFTETQLQQLAALQNLYKEWNEKINVISRKDIDALYERHVLHSLSIAAAFPFPAGVEIIDIGTGGGFPGVPLAMFFPEAKFHLVDSIGKKLKIIDDVKEKTGLQNITTQHIRAEEIQGRTFDFAVSRAVAPLKDLWRWSKPLLRKPEAGGRREEVESRKEEGGRAIRSGLICLKGGDLSGEIRESGLKPKMLEISEIFDEAFFKEKYIVYVKI